MPGPLWSDEEQQKFVQRLHDSTKAVQKVAAYQMAKGRRVEIPPIVVSPSAAENVNHSDNGDLFLLIAERKLRLEIKHRKRHFTCAEDWPDPHVFVSKVAYVDKAGDVMAYVIVNLGLTHAAVIYGWTKKYWYKLFNQPSNTGFPEEVYCCPLEHVQFVKLST